MLLKHMPDTTNTDRQDEKPVKQCRRIDHTYYTLSTLHMTQKKWFTMLQTKPCKKITIAAA